MPRRRNNPSATAVLAKALAKTSIAPRRRRRVARAGVVSGRGLYRGIGRDAGTVVGGAIGGVAGGLATGSPYGVLPGLKAGGYMGGNIGRLIEGSVRGRGAYRINYNSIIGNVPAIRNSRGREGATVVRHREYIGDVQSSTGFQIQYQLPINAAQAITFPWLSQIAQNYEQYEIQGMLFEYVSSSGDTTAGTTALGDVIMATQYNSLEPVFTTKQSMLNQEFSSLAKPSLNSIHPIECAPRQTTLELLYTRPQAPQPGGDLRLYDLGSFSLATNGQQAQGQVIGSLYCTYEVVLMKPKLSNGSGDISPSWSRALLANANENGSPFGDQIDPIPVFQTNDFGVKLNLNTLTLPKGLYGGFMIVCMWQNANINPSSKFFVSNVNGDTNSITYMDYLPNYPGESTPTTSIWPPNQLFPPNLGTAFWVCTLKCTKPLQQETNFVFQGTAISPSSSQWKTGVFLMTACPMEED